MCPHLSANRCPDGVRLVEYLLLPDDSVAIGQRHGHTMANSLEEALGRLRSIGYTEEQLRDVREYIRRSSKSSREIPVEVAAA